MKTLRMIVTNVQKGKYEEQQNHTYTQQYYFCLFLPNCVTVNIHYLPQTIQPTTIYPHLVQGLSVHDMYLDASIHINYTVLDHKDEGKR
jgi:hypothetical protein